MQYSFLTLKSSEHGAAIKSNHPMFPTTFVRGMDSRTSAFYTDAKF